MTDLQLHVIFQSIIKNCSVGIFSIISGHFWMVEIHYNVFAVLPNTFVYYFFKNINVVMMKMQIDTDIFGKIFKK